MSKRTQQLRAENNALEASLSPASKAVLTDMVVYMSSSRLGEYELELVRRDITQMLIDGEGRGESAAEIIGGDYRRFCDSIISEFPGRTASSVFLSGLRTFLLCASVLLAIKAVSSALSGLLANDGWPNVTITVGDVASFAMIIASSLAILAYISKKSFNHEALNSWKTFAALFAVILVIMCVYVFIRRPLFELHVALFAILPVSAFAGYKLLDAKLD